MERTLASLQPAENYIWIENYFFPLGIPSTYHIPIDIKINLQHKTELELTNIYDYTSGG